MTFDEFEKMSSCGNVIPVYSKVVADMETPVSVLARFADDENVFLFESVEAGERFGRWSFIGISPSEIFEAGNGKSIRDLRQAFAGLREVIIPDLPPLAGGAVGFMDYETAGEFENLPTPKGGAPNITARFMMADQIIAFDNLKHIMYIIVATRTENFSSLHAAYDDAQAKIAHIKGRLRLAPEVPITDSPHFPRLRSLMDREDFLQAVETAKEAIREGEIFQVVLSQRFQVPCSIPPLQIYRALRLVNPSPYMFFLKFGRKILIGSSPETLVKLEDKQVLLRPIAGSRPRGHDENSDQQMASELLSDTKERAEHLMLVDLARNDAGRIARTGTVQVRDFMTVERYSHIMHLVSTVEATLRDGLDAFDVLEAVFPAGTLSGAPKIRAMEIIHSLEPHARGFYGGAIGYFSLSGNMDLAITIRTLHIEHGLVTLQSGAGIVFDSDPEKEYQETFHKAQALVAALKLATQIC